jgi:hypothetical protein
MPSDLWRTFILAPSLSVLSVASAEAREKTDVVYFTNGDRILCEIKKLERGKLTVKSIGFGTIRIEWDKIAYLESTHTYDVVLRSGLRYLGALKPGSEGGKLEVLATAGTTELDCGLIVALDAVDESFWERFEGAVDLGYEFTQAGSATSWNLGAESRYRAERALTKASFDSLLKAQEGAERVERNHLRLAHIRFLHARWFGLLLGQGESSSNQALRFRALLGGGVGHELYRTDHTSFSVLGGASFSREEYDDSDGFLDNGELIGGVLFDTFWFDTPEVEITSSFLILPNLTQSGRYRIQANAKMRFELIKDFYWSLGVFESFDKKPPSELALRNDFGVTTSIGWSF